MHNTGFVNDKPIHLDVGKMHEDETIKQQDVYEKDLAWVASKFDVWLKNEYPSEYPEIARDIEDKLSEMLGKKFQLTN